jgi:subtilase family serine protease
LVGHLPSTQRLSLAISLPLPYEADLDDLLQQIYDPQSPSYRHYLSVVEFAARFGPSEAGYAAVLNFARAHGLTVIDPAANRMVLDVEGPAENIEKAFHVTLGVYQHPTENRTFYAPDREPTLDLDVPLLHISGLDNFTLPHSKIIRPVQKAVAKNLGTGSGPGGNYIGSDLRDAYYGSGPLTGQGQAIALVEFGGYDLYDVQNYFHQVQEPLNVPVRGVSVNGVKVACKFPYNCYDIEQSVDIETAISMAPGLSEVIVYVGHNDISIFNRMAVDNAAQQISCSWGWSDDESSLDPILKQMAAQGQSVFVATGDYGSSSPLVWPADDPYVTGVGGTNLTTTGPGGAWLAENGWYGSAGNFAKNGLAIPAYQQLPGVIDVLNQGSRKWRNYPDVAAEAQEDMFFCFEDFCSGRVGGTSVATPEWAGIIAMANEQAAANGKPPLGFLNPSLYRIGIGSSYDSDFHDITSGSNGGYTAVVGYDLVTGWGSPNGPSLIDALAGSGANQ